MSLSSFLLSSNGVDSELDDLFRSNTSNPTTLSNPAQGPKGSAKTKKRAQSESSNSITPTQIKKSKRNPPDFISSRTTSNETTDGPPPAVDQGDSDFTDGSHIVHESLRKVKMRNVKRPHKVVYAPPDETPSQRNLRTIFVGNLPISVTQKKLHRRELQRHILSFVPSAKIESLRFRSVPFQTPTSKIPTSDDDSKSTKKAKPRSHSDDADSRNPRAHNKDRALAWRERREEDELRSDQKKFLTPDQKKKISFINQDFHSSADTMNAYMVFAHPAPTGTYLSTVPSLPSMDPYEAACLAAEKADGTLFKERVLRVDVSEKSSPVHDAGDPKLSIFVGNLEFATAEEDLRAYFEGVVAAERGPPPQKDEASKPSTWVTRVRIIRDRETQLGKGFGYVQFVDRECVDELIALEDGKLKFAKRKLRVQRCKVLSGSGGTVSKARVTPSKGNNTKTKEALNPVVPKGDPSFGEQISNLTKEERKKAKATNADRVARRLAKKKARNALGNNIKPLAKDRTRVRKSQTVKARSIVDKPRKGRIRSDRALDKRNVKR